MSTIKAVISTSGDDLYLPLIPFTIYSWNQLGIDVIVMTDEATANSTRFEIATSATDLRFETLTFSCEDFELATYCQTSRLFGALNQDDDTVLITGDVDMCVFSTDLFSDPGNDALIVGVDLVPENKITGLVQAPMCYVLMKASTWKKVLNFNSTDNLTQVLSSHLEIIKPINRGAHWCFDQWYLAEQLIRSGVSLSTVERRVSDSNLTATRRADRDGWLLEQKFENLVDAHLPRPLSVSQNFDKIYDLFCDQYPDNDLDWMQQYYLNFPFQKR